MSGADLRLTFLPINDPANKPSDRFHLRAKVEGRNFELILFLSDLNRSQAWLESNQRKVKASLDISRVASLSMEQINRVLTILRIENFIILKSEITLVLANMPDISIESGRGLTHVLLSCESPPSLLPPWLQKVADEMVLQFSNKTKTITPALIAEITEILPVCRREQKFGPILATLTALCSDPQIWEEERFLAALLELTTGLKKANDDQLFLDVTKETTVKFLNTASEITVRVPVPIVPELSPKASQVTPEQFLGSISKLEPVPLKEIVEFLLNRMGKSSKAGSLTMICLNLLEAIATTGYWGGPLNGRKDLQEALAQVQNSDPEIQELTSFCSFLLNNTVTKDSKWHERFNFGQGILEALTELEKAFAASTFQGLLTAFNQSAVKFRKAFSSLSPSTQGASWMIPFFILRKIGERAPAILLTINYSTSVLQRMGFNEFPTCVRRWLIREMAKFLQPSQLVQRGVEAIKHLVKFATLGEATYVQNIIIEAYFNAIPETQAALLGCCRANGWSVTLLSTLSPRLTPQPSTELFDFALSLHAPYDWKLRRGLQADFITQPDMPYVELDATLESEPQQTLPLRKICTRFLSSKDERSVMGSLFTNTTEERVLLITGNPGAGKTLFCKKFAWDLMNSQSGLNGDKWLVVFVPLSMLTDPATDIIRKSLKLHFIERPEQIEELKTKRVLWIFDEYEKGDFPVDGKGQSVPKNLYRTNQLEHWVNWKFIFNCNSTFEFQPEMHFSPTKGVLVHAKIAFLDEGKSAEFMRNFAAMRNTSPGPYQESLSFLKSMGFGRIQLNPGLLINLLEALPQLAKKQTAIGATGETNPTLKFRPFSFMVPHLFRLESIFSIKISPNITFEERSQRIFEVCLYWCLQKEFAEIERAGAALLGLRDLNNRSLFSVLLEKADREVIERVLQLKLEQVLSSGDFISSLREVKRFGRYEDLAPLLFPAICQYLEQPEYISQLFHAIGTGYEEVVDAFTACKRELVSQVFKSEGFSFSPTAWAAARGQVNCLQRLLVQSSAWESRVKGLGNLLHVVIYFNQISTLIYLAKKYKPEFKKLLADSKDNPEQQNPFLLATAMGSGATSFLIEEGADPASTDAQGNSAFHLAVRNGHFDTAQFLIYLKAAHFDLRNGARKKALDYVDLSKHRDLRNYLKKFQHAAARLNPPIPNISVPKPTNLVLNGNVTSALGALDFLEDQDFLTDLQRVASTSTQSALLALFLSLGFTILDIQKFMAEAQSSLIHSSKLSNEQRRAMRENINGLKTIWAYVRSTPQALVGLEPYYVILWGAIGIDKADKFADWIDKIIEAKTGIRHLTFGRLNALIQEGEPYKHLHLACRKIGVYSEIVRLTSEDPNWQHLIISDGLRMAIAETGITTPYPVYYNVKGERILQQEHGLFLGIEGDANFSAEFFDSTLYMQGSSSEIGQDRYSYHHKTIALWFQEQSADRIALSRLIVEADENEEIAPRNVGRVIRGEGHRQWRGDQLARAFLASPIHDYTPLSFLPPLPPLKGIATLARDRMRIITEMAEYLLDDRWHWGKSIGALVLYGLPSLENTELALKFAQQHEEAFSFIYLIDCTDNGSYINAFKGLGDKLKLSFNQDLPPHEIVFSVVTTLETSIFSKPWLLIYTNATEPVTYPNRGGCIIGISETRDPWPSTAHFLDVPHFSQREVPIASASLSSSEHTSRRKKSASESVRPSLVGMESAVVRTAHAPSLLSSTDDHITLETASEEPPYIRLSAIPSSVWEIRSLKNTHELVQAIRDFPQATWLSEIAHDIVEDFLKFRMPDVSHLEEIVEIAAIVSETDRNRLIDALFAQIQKAPASLLQGISSLFVKISILTAASQNVLQERIKKIQEVLGKHPPPLTESKTLPEISTRLFQEAFYRKMPLAWKIGRKFLQDRNFQLELPFFQPMLGRAHPSLPPAPIEQLVVRFLNNPNKRVLLISSELALGKSFLLKRFAWDLLRKYPPDMSHDDYLPLYVPLRRLSLETATNGLIEATLKEYDFQSNDLTIATLKKKKLLLMIDGYNELPFPVDGKNGELLLKNIYQANQLSEWPLIKLMFTFRTGFCEDRWFEPERPDLLEKVTLEYSATSHLEEQIKAITQPWKSNGIWKISQYMKVLDMFAGRGLDFIFSHPLYFKVVLYALPLMQKRWQQRFEFQPLTQLIETHPNEFKTELLRLMVAALAIRTEQKYKSSPLADPLEINEMIDYAFQVAHALKSASRTSFSVQELKEDNPFANKLKKVVTGDFHELALRFACLIYRGGSWQFLNDSYVAFFASFEKKNEVDELKRFIEEDPYELKKLILYL